MLNDLWTLGKNITLSVLAMKDDYAEFVTLSQNKPNTVVQKVAQSGQKVSSFFQDLQNTATDMEIEKLCTITPLEVEKFLQNSRFDGIAKHFHPD